MGRRDHWVVYGLTDPRIEDEIKRVWYIGVTIDLYKRYAQHLLDESHPRKLERMNELRVLDMLPGLIILETVPAGGRSSSQQREYYWQWHYRNHGANLVNGFREQPSRSASVFRFNNLYGYFKQTGVSILLLKETLGFGTLHFNNVFFHGVAVKVEEANRILETLNSTLQSAGQDKAMWEDLGKWL